MRRRPELILTVLVFLLAAMSLTALLAEAQEQSSSSQDQAAKDQQQKKKKGGFFGGLKAITGESSEQTEATRTAGSKTIGEGERIGDVQPTADDRQKVNGMEKYSVPEKDLKQFQEDGHLKPKQ